MPPAGGRAEERKVSRHLAGDMSRVLRESLRCVHGAVALVTVTQPERSIIGRRPNGGGR